MKRNRLIVISIFFLILALVIVSSNKVSLAAKIDKPWPGHLRGMCLGKLSEAATTQKVFSRLAQWHVNIVTVNICTDKILGIKDSGNELDYPPQMADYCGAFRRLDKILVLARKHNMHVILSAGALKGRRKLNVWQANTTPKNASAFVDHLSEFWLYTANRYKNEPVLLAYDILGEPHGKSLVKIWRYQIAPELIRKIRTVDAQTWLLFEPGPWGMPGGYKKLEPLRDIRKGESKIAYGFHMYAPHNYTHQGIRPKNSKNIYRRPRNQVYPGMLKMFPGSILKQWDREALEMYMKPALDFKKRHDIHMYIGEFSVIRWAPGRAIWVDDVISIFEENGLDWAFHSYTGWNGWNPTFPAEAKGNKKPDGGYEGERLKVLKKYWLINCEI